MTLRFVTTLFGCMIIGGASAAVVRSTGWSGVTSATASLASAPSEAEPTAALPLPPFLQAAIDGPAPTAWPPDGAVAFYDETFALLTTVATARLVEPRTAERRATAPRPVASEPAAQQVADNTPAPQAAEPSPPPVRPRVAGSGEPAPEPPPAREPETTAAPGDRPTPPRAGSEPRSPRAGNPPARANDMVEIVIRDRFGRPVRVERVERWRLAPPPGRVPYGLHGTYSPYGYDPRGSYGRYHD